MTGHAGWNPKKGGAASMAAQGPNSSCAVVEARAETTARILGADVDPARDIVRGHPTHRLG